MSQITNEILSLADCLAYADETKELVNKKDALAEIPGLLSKFYEFETVCIVADENTFAAAGKKAGEIIEGAGIKIAGVHIFPREPRLHAEYDHIVFLKKWIHSLPGFPKIVPVVIGGGTLNDLIKQASSELELTYFCIPSASSVDGYTANGAALLVDGLKQTLGCAAPKVLVADTDVIAGAPAYLSSSGFGDLASKIIAGTDWIIADEAGSHGAPEGHAIDPVPWKMVQNGLMDALNRSVNAAKGDSEAVNTLFQSLAITGLAMQYMKNARPVSGAEHLWSHVWEMEDLSFNGEPVTHGHKVAIGTLIATAFTEIFFANPKGPPDVPKDYRRPGRDERKAEVLATFKNNKGRDLIADTSMAKLMDEKKAETVNQAFRDSWKEIRDQVLEKLLPYEKLRELFSVAQCPLQSEAIGLKRSDAIATLHRAQMIRNKYCVFDLAWDMGNFTDVLQKIEDSNLYLR